MRSRDMASQGRAQGSIRSSGSHIYRTATDAFHHFISQSSRGGERASSGKRKRSGNTVVEQDRTDKYGSEPHSSRTSVKRPRASREEVVKDEADQDQEEEEVINARDGDSEELDYNSNMERGRRSSQESSEVEGSAAEDEDKDTKPTTTEWRSWTSFDNITLRCRTEPEVCYTFTAKDTVYVLPDGHDPRAERDPGPRDVWIARIQSIKEQPVTREVWCKINWFYTKNQFIAVMKQDRRIKLNPSHLGEYEVIETDHTDYISSNSIDGHVAILRIDENDVDQELPGKDSHYSRITYKFSGHNCLDSRRTCKAGSRKCDKPYDPNRSSQYYCAPCQNWYHDRCLELARWKLTPAVERKLPASPEELILKAHLPDTARSLKQLTDSKQKGGGSSKGSRVKSRFVGNEARPPGIPPLLLELAQEQIIRGGEYGLLGNVKHVLLARHIVAEVEAGESRLLDTWEEVVGAEFVVKFRKLVQSGNKPSPHYYVCGHCKNII